MLKEDSIKTQYLDSKYKLIDRAMGKVLVHSFYVISNHCHEASSLLENSKHLSN
jgi:hypothetical protein